MGVWTAPGAQETTPKGGARSAPPFEVVSGAPGSDQNRKIYDFWVGHETKTKRTPQLENPTPTPVITTIQGMPPKDLYGPGTRVILVAIKPRNTIHNLSFVLSAISRPNLGPRTAQTGQARTMVQNAPKSSPGCHCLVYAPKAKSK